MSRIPLGFICSRSLEIALQAGSDLGITGVWSWTLSYQHLQHSVLRSYSVTHLELPRRFSFRQLDVVHSLSAARKLKVKAAVAKSWKTIRRFTR